MAYSITKDKIIQYPPERLFEYGVTMFEWIDNLHFIMNPVDCITNADEYVVIAKERFLNAGWDGDGDIGLIWIPPFMLTNEETSWETEGLIIWHVKQQEDGISWLLHPPDFFKRDNLAP